MPPKKNPLRRLSVALGLQDAYVPSPSEQVPSSSIPVDTATSSATPAEPTAPETVTTNEASILSKFLAKQKTDWLKDVTEDPIGAANKWVVVMGNEAGGTSYLFFEFL